MGKEMVNEDARWLMIENLKDKCEREMSSRADGKVIDADNEITERCDVDFIMIL